MNRSFQIVWVPFVLLLLFGMGALGQGSAPVQTVELSAGELKLVVGNEADHGAGRTGYIGIWSLTSVHESTNVFVPKYAGWILHRNRATVTRGSATEAVIDHLDPDGKRYASQTFRVAAPYYFDCIIAREGKGPVPLGAASYINGPDDDGIYFVNQDMRWQRHYDPVHGDAACVLPLGMPVPVVEKVPDSPYPHGNARFQDSFSNWRYHPDYALFYGHFKDMVLVHMFPPRCNLIPYMSPRGGGPRADGRGNNPAWDWRIDVPTGADSVARLSFRAIYKKYVNDEDILNEYRRWVTSLPKHP